MPEPDPRHARLAELGQQLEVLPVSRLRPMVGTRSKRLRKAELVGMVAACC
jgi:hypothetical protein